MAKKKTVSEGYKILDKLQSQTEKMEAANQPYAILDKLQRDTEQMARRNLELEKTGTITVDQQRELDAETKRRREALDRIYSSRRTATGFRIQDNGYQDFKNRLPDALGRERANRLFSSACNRFSTLR